MAAVASQPPTGPNSSRSSSVMNGHPAVDYINGHGALPDSPASGSTPISAPVAPVSKKTKAKKPVDDNEKAKLVAARLNQLEIGFAEEKDQELEIGGSPSYAGNSAHRRDSSKRRHMAVMILPVIDNKPCVLMHHIPDSTLLISTLN